MKAVFVLWSRAVTPTGVVVNLASPGTDPLGRAGVHGEVDTKFWDRFGGALLFSLLQDSMTIAAARASQSGNGNSVVVLPSTQSTGTTAASEILKQGSDIKPSLYKNQGESVAITVARDVDFSTVYNLSMNRPK
jgi:type IV secretion system protein VirB10